MKQFFKSHAILFSMLAVLIGCLIYPNQADAKTYQTQDNYIGSGGCSVVISNNKVLFDHRDRKDLLLRYQNEEDKNHCQGKWKRIWQLKEKGKLSLCSL